MVTITSAIGWYGYRIKTGQELLAEQISPSQDAMKTIKEDMVANQENISRKKWKLDNPLGKKIREFWSGGNEERNEIWPGRDEGRFWVIEKLIRRNTLSYGKKELTT